MCKNDKKKRGDKNDLDLDTQIYSYPNHKKSRTKLCFICILDF